MMLRLLFVSRRAELGGGTKAGAGAAGSIGHREEGEEEAVAAAEAGQRADGRQERSRGEKFQRSFLFEAGFVGPTERLAKLKG